MEVVCVGVGGSYSRCSAARHSHLFHHCSVMDSLDRWSWNGTVLFPGGTVVVPWGPQPHIFCLPRT